MRRSYLYTLLCLVWLSASCVSTRKATYFNGVNDRLIAEKTPIPESVIQKNDILSISVSSPSAEASAPYNAPNSGGITVGGTLIGAGYLVSPDGTIQFPGLGSFKAAGLTKDQLKEGIRRRLIDKELLIDPIVTIRFLNFRVTVLGEVAHPAVINVPSEKVSLLEAVGLAGDLTIYANRENVLLIREENEEKIIKRLNLNSDELLTSPYYYLKSNDIIYVEPNKAKVASSGRSQQWIPLVFSALSLAVIVVDRVVQ